MTALMFGISNWYIRGADWMRINIDTEFFGDERVELLAETLDENKFGARGRLISVWHKAYLKRSPVLSIKEINLSGGHPEMASAMIGSDLAELTDDGIFIKGVADRIEWLLKKVEAGKTGGRRSVEARVAKFGSATPRATAKQTRSTRSGAGVISTLEAKTKHPRSKRSGNAKQHFAKHEAPTNPPAPAPAPAHSPALKPQTPSLRERAAELSSEILCAAFELQLDDAAAKDRLGNKMRFAVGRFGSWENFVKAYSAAFQSGRGPAFEREFRLAIKGKLACKPDETKDTRMEDLFPC